MAIPLFVQKWAERIPDTAPLLIAASNATGK